MVALFVLVRVASAPSMPLLADSAPGSVVLQLTQAISLATAANNGTMNSSNVKSISNQIAGILGEVTTLANTANQGQFILAGGQASNAPINTSNTSSPAVTTYSGDSTVNYLQMPNGQEIQLNVPGDQIFSGTGSNNVFAALNSLVDDYSTGTVNTAKAASDSQALSSALNYLSKQRVVIDNSITHLTAASDAVTNEQTQLIAAQTIWTPGGAIPHRICSPVSIFQALPASGMASAPSILN